MNKIIRFVVMILFSICILQGVEKEKDICNLYILSFDNVQDNNEIDWLKESLVDFIIKHYNINDRVNADRTDNLDKLLKDIRQKKSVTYQNNVLLTGTFKREFGNYIIELHFTNINSWEEIGRRTVVEKSSDLALLVDAINKAIDKVLLAEYEEVAQGDFNLLVKETQGGAQLQVQTQNVSSKDVSQATKNIASAIDNFEKKIFQNSSQSSDEFKMELNNKKKKVNDNLFSLKINQYIDNKDSFLEIVDRILVNPYKIEIDEPYFQRQALNPEIVEIQFNVKYILRRELINGMLESLPCRREKISGFTEYFFSDDQFFFEDVIINKISYGDLNYYPVIFLLNSEGGNVYSIIDSPSSEMNNSANIHKFTNFSPLLNFLTSSSGIKIYSKDQDSEFTYSLNLPINSLSKIDQIQVQMMSNKEIREFLSE